MTTRPVQYARRPDRRRRAPAPGFATRLLIAQSLVLVAGAVTTWLVAAAVAPSIFYEHLRRAGIAPLPAEMTHVEEAFASALLISLAVAVAAAAAMALAVTWYFSRRMQRAIGAVADAGAEIAAGHYAAPVPRPGLGREFEQLTTSLVQLADRLDNTEITRRRMLADLAHEMRTPLATLDAHLEAIEDGVRVIDPPTLTILQDSSRRLGRLAQDISAVSQAQEGNLEIRPELVEVDEVLHAAINAAADSYRAKGVTLLDPATVRATVQVDPHRMGQILGNLLDNALRHTPSGGTVTLTADIRHPWVEITVHDTGEGIVAEHLPHIFERFYRADGSRATTRAGSGIGLTIARALVDAQGGRISAHSDGPGTGATLTINLPAR
ncbi:MAG TPA: ATP-binding protein [Microlunatus sp.]